MQRSFLLLCSLASLFFSFGVAAQTSAPPANPIGKNDNGWKRFSGDEPKKVNLSGIWMVKLHEHDYMQIRLQQDGDNIKSCIIPKPQACEKETTFEGHCVSADGGGPCMPNSVYAGHFIDDKSISLTAQFTPEHLEAVHDTIEILDPDRIRSVYFPPDVWMWRAIPRPDDVPCDGQNTSHVRADFAFFRAKSAVKDHQDYTKGACWLRVSANQGNARSQSMLALLLHDGKGIEKDLPQAFALAKRSAESGDFIGESVLGIMYLNGEGTERNAKAAQYWMAKAKAQLPMTAEEQEQAERRSRQMVGIATATVAITTLLVLGALISDSAPEDPVARKAAQARHNYEMGIQAQEIRKKDIEDYYEYLTVLSRLAGEINAAR